MKRLTLLRHAKSGDDGHVARDFDRRLNAKGRRAAHTVGAHMREAGLRFDRIIASPAVRIAETLEEVATGYGGALAPEWERRIYLASADELLDLVRATPEGSDSLLLVGHNPGLEDLVLALVPAADGGVARGAVAAKYPTASLAELAIDADRWANLSEGTARLLAFTRPRDLDPELGPDYD